MVSALTADGLSIELAKVSKVYPPDIIALQNVSLNIAAGEMIFLTGKSGAGKSTLLKLLCCLENPTKGVIEVGGMDLAKLKQPEVQLLRQKIGVAYQDFKLLPKLTAMQNIAMAMEVRFKSSSEIRHRIDDLLAKLDMSNKRDKRVDKLSRGEQQRVTLARAAANRPALLLADEPTGNLDPTSKELVVELFRDLNRNGTTIIIATHDEKLYNDNSRRRIHLRYGKLSVVGESQVQ